MEWFRNHWFIIGGLLIIPSVIFLIFWGYELTYFQWLLWANLIALLLHQLEEYYLPGTFPFMLNRVMFKSTVADRFPLNTNTSMVINVSGWLIYLFAALFAEKALWLAIIAMMVSFGNFIAHTFVFNIKGRTAYNAGMLTSWLLFLPIAILFGMELIFNKDVSALIAITGITLGIAVNAAIILLIKSLADEETSYIFRRQ